MENQAKKKQKRDDTATIVADIMGVTADYVRKVINGDRENEDILAVYMELKQGKSRLVEAVRHAIESYDESKHK